VPICYSLGNFVFYQETDLLYRKLGYLVKAGITKNSVSHIKIVPYEINANSLNLLKEDKYARFMNALQKISMPLSNDQTIKDAWHGFLRYYGINGFYKEIDMIIKRMVDEPQKGAAMLRNRVATMQHNQHWIDAMTRIMEGTIDESPAWAFELTKEWLTKKR
jgi:poly-gamma-glutamate synthesis protein (capsule biosynthesis protein)